VALGWNDFTAVIYPLRRVEVSASAGTRDREGSAHYVHNATLIRNLIIESSRIVEFHYSLGHLSINVSDWREPPGTRCAKDKIYRSILPNGILLCKCSNKWTSGHFTKLCLFLLLRTRCA